ncbi:glycine zipper 2TM domain-containing protein [Ramlibacter henchirensis]|uniref:glycine zipper 2TM domain-containing protein n=1 Tax=Ramlibacter henchirensis TaxID=204072 RepID=UPI0019806363|nr:glycine zipper 2TM domain-containing protein [Ramlibacter henchirensis]
MSAATSTQAPGSTQSAPSGLGAVPRAMWVVLGTLGLATAGLAGALVMRSIDDKPAPAAAMSAQTAPTQVAAAQQSQLQAPVQAAQPAPAQYQAAPQEAPAAKPAPQRVAKPAPARPAVQQATGSATHPAPVEAVPQVVQAPAPSRAVTPIETTRAAICNTCGTVQAVQEVKEKGQGTGLGAVGGAVVGGLLGNQVGGGNGKKVMTVVGAVGGGLAGHEAEKHVRATTAYDVQVRMEDGSVRTIRRAEPIAPGTRVFVEGNNLRVGGQSSGSGQPRTIRTSGEGA